MGGEGEGRVQPESKIFVTGHQLQFRAVGAEDFGSRGGIRFPVKDDAFGFLGVKEKVKAMEVLLY